tara:strand:- start:650 stop:1768 length:1119 start_codon:yes stop_codon:yes gene_type:complete
MQKNNSIINYKINKVTHKICYSNKTTFYLKKDILQIKNNPKLLFIYDNNINSQIIKNFKKVFKSIKNKSYFLPVEGGKHNKDLNLLFKIVKILNKNNFTKNSIIVSLGGGVVGDVSSFAAAIYMRGTYYFHIPSTMTSILDSCIGGKTAVNYDNKINLLGTYYHPYRVYLSYEILKSIPDREYKTGFAEAIKCGIIDDKSILKILDSKYSNIIKRNFLTLKTICLKVLSSKIKFFINDVREKNQRLMLNFGHTFAHAIEMAGSLNNKYQINHGEAVSLGILCEMKYAGTKKKFIDYINNIILKFDLPRKVSLNKISKEIFYKRVYENLFLDKKRISKYPRYIKIDKNLKPSISELKNLKRVKKIIKDTVKTI